MMSCSGLSKPVGDLLLFFPGTVHQAWGWAALQGLARTRRQVTKAPSLGGVRIRVSEIVSIPQAGIADLMCSFQFWILRGKNNWSHGGTCEMFQQKQNSTLPYFGLGANGIFPHHLTTKTVLDTQSSRGHDYQCLFLSIRKYQNTTFPSFSKHLPRSVQKDMKSDVQCALLLL